MRTLISNSLPLRGSIINYWQLKDSVDGPFKDKVTLLDTSISVGAKRCHSPGFYCGWFKVQGLSVTVLILKLAFSCSKKKNISINYATI